jgi:hypothetical protein
LPHKNVAQTVISPLSEADSEVVDVSSAVGADPVLVAAHVDRLSHTGTAVVVLAVFALVAALYLARASLCHC